MKITIDAGHGTGYNPGAVKPYYEGDMTLTLAKYYAVELAVYGHEIDQTRTGTKDELSAQERGTYAANNGSEMLLSIHSNGFNDEKACGTTTIYSVQRQSTAPLADKITKAITNVFWAYGASNSYSRNSFYRTLDDDKTRDHYGVLRKAVASDKMRYAFIIEHGFHSNVAECTVLLKDDALRDMAKMAVGAMAEYFGWQKSEPTPTPPKTQKYQVGDIVDFGGGYHYGSSVATEPSKLCTAGVATVTAVNLNGTHQYALVRVEGSQSNVYGWVDDTDILGLHKPKQAFSDVTDGKWYSEAINALHDADIAHGYPDGTYRPDAPCTRAEVAQLVYNLYKQGVKK